MRTERLCWVRVYHTSAVGIPQALHFWHPPYRVRPNVEIKLSGTNYLCNDKSRCETCNVLEPVHQRRPTQLSYGRITQNTQ